jgi:CHASE3 domain sensor protein
MFARMTIGTKLTIGFAALLACVLGLSYFSLSAVGSLRSQLDSTTNRTARKIDLGGVLDRNTSQMRAEVRATLLATYAKNKADLETAGKNFADLATQQEQALKEIRPLLDTESGRKGAESVESSLSAWKAAYAEIVRLCVAGRTEEALHYRTEKEAPVAKMMADGAAEILAAQKELLAASSKAALAEATSSRWAVIVCMGISLVVGALSLYVIHQVNRSLRDVIAQLSEGAGRWRARPGRFLRRASRWRRDPPSRRRRWKKPRPRARRSTPWRARTPRTRRRRMGW